MIKLSDGGAYLINGVDIVEDSASAVNEVAAKTGCSVKIGRASCRERV